MVCDALDYYAFKRKPEIRENCVRVYYDEGHHIDMPVYRTENPDTKGTLFEIASTDWKKSNPEAVKKWFQNQLKAKHSSRESEGNHLLRRLLRLLKNFSISRPSWNMPSGFILTVLTNEQYFDYDDRDDRAFFKLIKAIKSRLDVSLVVWHPVLPETITKTETDANMKELRERLEWAITELKITETTDSKKEALKAWRKIFNTDYFDSDIEGYIVDSFVVSTNTPTEPVHKAGGGRFG
ncbi:MAG: hypothetical protein EHM20_13750 [Alphaproteobacteria bacterium]|nr:MAG: hypothetical protein EHM20_13750 [Alphaproteobacteria bacterium]